MLPLVERVDDIALIIAYLKNKKIDLFVDKYMPNHGNQNNLSNGNVAIIWLSYVLSQSDHRKSHVKDWVEKHQMILSSCIGCEFDLNNFSDDRLARLLYKFSLDKNWHPMETEIAKETLSLIPLDSMLLERYFNPQADKLIKGAFKLDSTSFTGHHEVDEDGLMRYGFSNSNFEGLPQIKLMNCTDGFFGCSLVSTIASGNQNDEVMYIPTLERMRKSFNTEGFLFCGDSKLSTKNVLDNVVINKEFYLCPLQLSDKKNRESFVTWIDQALDGSQAIHQIYNGEEHYGFGYEFEREQITKNGEKWIERVLLIKSLGYFEGEKKQFKKKLAKIKELLGKSKTKLFKTPEEALEKLKKDLEKIFESNFLARELFEIKVSTEEIKKTYKRSKRNGEYEIKQYRAYVEKLSINEEILKSLEERIGWRSFVTNVPSNCLGFSEAYSYYRTSQHVIESGHHFFKSEPIGIAPLYVSREDQLKGLIRFLSLGVLFLKLLSSEITLRLKERKEELAGLTAGQPSRKTSSPTTKSILSYFCRSSISLIVFEVNGVKTIKVGKLSTLCCKILELLDLSDAYVNLEKFKG